MDKVYDLIIVGGGPAGAGAGVYAGRKKLNTLVIKAAWGGQSVVSPDIHNWIGTKSISGEKLAKDLQEHVEAYKSDIFEIVTGEVVKVEGASPLFIVTTKENKTYQSKTVLVTAGSNRRTLDIPGAAEFEHKGLTYCASCDGLFFANMDVVVVGAGNAGFESALQLSAYCKSVTILIRGENIRADELTVEAAKRDPKIKLMFNTVPVEVVGDKTVTGLKVNANGAEETLNVSGVFVEIGQIPNTSCVKDLAKMDAIGKIEIDPWTGRTSVPGIWAAGDCTNIKYHQNNIAVGEGVKALEDIYQYIKQKLAYPNFIKGPKKKGKRKSKIFMQEKQKRKSPGISGGKIFQRQLERLSGPEPKLRKPKYTLPEGNSKEDRKKRQTALSRLVYISYIQQQKEDPDVELGHLLKGLNLRLTADDIQYLNNKFSEIKEVALKSKTRVKRNK